MQHALRLRRLAREDFPLLARWLAEPHVARWWAHRASAAALEADFGPAIDRAEPTDVFIATAADCPIGLVQRYRLADYADYLNELSSVVTGPDGSYGIDYFVGEPGALRRGLGTALIRAAVQSIWRDDRAARAVLVAVHASNVASSRVLLRAGFARVGAGQLAPDNPIDTRDHLVYRIDRPASRRSPKACPPDDA